MEPELDVSCLQGCAVYHLNLESGEAGATAMGVFRYFPGELDVTETEGVSSKVSGVTGWRSVVIVGATRIRCSKLQNRKRL